jgi:hypothetical protein
VRLSDTFRRAAARGRRSMPSSAPHHYRRYAPLGAVRPSHTNLPAGLNGLRDPELPPLHPRSQAAALPAVLLPASALRSGAHRSEKAGTGPSPALRASQEAQSPLTCVAGHDAT